MAICCAQDDDDRLKSRLPASHDGFVGEICFRGVASDVVGKESHAQFVNKLIGKKYVDISFLQVISELVGEKSFALKNFPGAHSLDGCLIVPIDKAGSSL